MDNRFNRPRTAPSPIAISLLLILLLISQGAWGLIRQGDPHQVRIDSLKATFGQALKTPMLDNGQSSGPVTAARTVRLGSAAAGPNSRGALVAQTWRDWMANANMNRTVATTTPGNTYGTGVQFAFMYKVSSVPSDRTLSAWNGYDATHGGFVCLGGTSSSCTIPPSGIAPNGVQASDYPKIVIYPENGRGIVGDYEWPDQVNNSGFVQMHVYFEANAFSGNFGNISSGSIVADTLNKSGNIAGNANTLWPALGMTVTATDTVIYMFGFEGITTQAYGALKVFRHLSTAQGNPDDNWQLVFSDTSFFPTQDFAASRVSSRVAAIWVNQTPAGRLSGTKQDNDVYYAVSPTGLPGTWTKHNLTNYTGAGYRAWLECNALFDSNDHLHIIWNAYTTDGVTFLSDRSCRLFHWSEYNPGTFSTIYSALFSAWDPPCTGGSNVLNVGKFSIGECDQRLYTVFSDWNDPQLAGVNDSDCATDASWLNGGNGELYVSVSKDLSGSSWAKPFNITNSVSKGCDSSGNCADDRWASISQIGIDNNIQPGTWPQSSMYDPSGSYAGSNYIDIFYETDRYPGGAILSPNQGPYTLNDMRWIRLACGGSVPEPMLITSPTKIDFPAYTKPGVETDTNILLQNIGNTTLQFSAISAVEDSCKGPGCQSGWLGFFGVNGSSTIPEGGSINMTLQLNKAGVISDMQAPKRAWGRVLFIYGPPTDTLVFPISLTIADSVAGVKFDTISTASSIKLVCGSNGDAGNNYAGKVNMNFPPTVECDTGSNSRGDAGIYLGDASPVILRKVGTNPARGSWSIFSQGYTTQYGFKPLAHGNPPTHTNAAKWQQFFSGTFTTVDSLLTVEKTWYAPTNAADTANFIIEKLRVWPSTPGAPVSNLAIGAAYDWDVPTDSGISYNAGGFDAARRLVYQRGFNSLDTIVDCSDNSLRYAGVALVAMTNQLFLDSCQYKHDSLYGGYTARNDSFVYPSSNFVPEQLWNKMQVPGFSNQGGSSSWADLHTVLTFRNFQDPVNGGWSFPAQAKDTLTVYSIMAVVRNAASAAAGLDSLKAVIDKGKKWAGYWLYGCKCCSCVGKRGNVNQSGIIDLADLAALVSYLTGGGYVLPDPSAANVNGVGIIDLSDLSALVSYLTGGGFVLVNCP